MLKSNTTSLFMILAVSFAISSCKTSSRTVKDYTPSTNISGLELDKSEKPTLVYKRPGAPDLGAYNAFIIDPVKVATGEPGAKEISPEDEERITTYFRDRVIEELRDGGYNITDTPADQTMRINFIVSGLKTPSAVPNVTQVLIPIAFSVGGVTVEAAFKEASSDRIDAVAIAKTEGARLANASPWSTWRDVEAALDKWAKGIRKSVDEAHGK